MENHEGDSGVTSEYNPDLWKKILRYLKELFKRHLELMSWYGNVNLQFGCMVQKF